MLPYQIHHLAQNSRNRNGSKCVFCVNSRKPVENSDAAEHESVNSATENAAEKERIYLHVEKVDITGAEDFCDWCWN